MNTQASTNGRKPRSGAAQAEAAHVTARAGSKSDDTSPVVRRLLIAVAIAAGAAGITLVVGLIWMAWLMHGFQREFG